MSASEEQRSALLQVVADTNLMPVFNNSDRQAFLFRRIEDFGAAYAKAIKRAPAETLPATANLGDLLAEQKRNPHRVHMLLQAIAYMCSPGILAMTWMTLLGARIEKLSYKYERENTSTLRVTLLLPDLMTRRNFTSRDHWDAAILRFAALSRVNEAPMIEGFHGLWIPPQKSWDHDYYVEIAQGTFGAVDIAPTTSPTPRWEVHQLFPKQPSRHIGSIDVHVQGGPVLSAVPPESDRPILDLVWRAFVTKYGDGMNRRPRRT